MDTDTTSARNPRQEASQLVGADLQPAVLEPSPPAVTDAEWFADDPVAVSPSATNPLRPGAGWAAWLESNPEHGDWAASRWLAGDRSLPAAPASLITTRQALHRLAAYVIAPARHRSNGKFGLRWTRGGFGTPFFGDDRQIRVEGNMLVDQLGGVARSTPITTLQAAAKFLGAEIDQDTAAEHDSTPLGDVDETLAVDGDSATFLGAWFGMAFAALEAVRADPASVNPSRPQLWPGHFDPAIEIGDDDHRGSYGASPGDHTIDEPYLYVSLWWPDRLPLVANDPRLNAPSFTGAVLRLSDFGGVSGSDDVDKATNFFTSIRDHTTR